MKSAAATEQEHLGQQIEETLKTHTRAAGYDLDQIRESGQTVIIRAVSPGLILPARLAEIIRQLSPGSLGIHGIELSHAPSNGTEKPATDSGRPYRTRLTVAARLPQDPFPADLHEVVRYNGQLNWREKIIPYDNPMDCVQFDTAGTPVMCGISGPKTGLTTGSEQHQGKIPVQPGEVLSLVTALSHTQTLNRVYRKSLVVL